MAMRSPYPDVEIPDVALAEFVYADAPARGDAVAIVDGPSGRSYSYALLHHLVGRCAAGLAERGVQQHDVVGVFAPNIPEWPIVFHGVAQLGAINTTINSLYTAQETARFFAREVPGHDPAVPRPRAARGRRGRDRRGVRDRRGRGRDAVRGGARDRSTHAGT